MRSERKYGNKKASIYAASRVSQLPKTINWLKGGTTLSMMMHASVTGGCLGKAISTSRKI